MPPPLARLLKVAPSSLVAQRGEKSIARALGRAAERFARLDDPRFECDRKGRRPRRPDDGRRGSKPLLRRPSVRIARRPRRPDDGRRGSNPLLRRPQVLTIAEGMSSIESVRVVGLYSSWADCVAKAKSVPAPSHQHGVASPTRGRFGAAGTAWMVCGPSWRCLAIVHFPDDPDSCLLRTRG